MARPQPRSVVAALVLGGLAAGALAGALLPLGWAALVIVVALVVALVLAVRRVESQDRPALGPAPFLATGIGVLVTRLVIELGLLGGVLAAVAVALLVLVLGGDLG